MAIEQLELGASEAALIATLAAELCSESFNDSRIPLLSRLREQSRRMPPPVIDIMDRLRSPDVRPYAASIAGLDVTALTALRTPTTFGQHDSIPGVRALHALMLLLGTLLGVPYSFITQQRGSFILDVFPLAGREDDQLGSSSTCMLEWHNEDAHHPMRADFSALMCIRNDQQAETRYAAVADMELPEDVEHELRKPQFVIISDVSHSYSYNLATSGVGAQSEHAFSQNEQMAGGLLRAPVLTGDRANPMICVDFPYMPPDLHSPEALRALGVLRSAIERAGQSLVLKSGTLLAFDNRHGVHGRGGFRASYDGNDRWLKRLNVLRDVTLSTAPQNVSAALRTV
jgi:Fe(II)/alpha-ketoglutarate-dependent arginine beta-hydroxylase